MRRTAERTKAWFRRLPPRQADRLLAAFVLGDTATEVLLTAAPPFDTRVALALSPVLAVTMLVRRTAPVTAVALGISVIVVYGLLDADVTSGVGGPYLVCLFLVFSMAMRCEGRQLWLGVAVATALGQLNVWTDQYGPNAIDALMLMLMLVVGPVTVGQLTRNRIELNRALREKAARAEEERARAAEEAVAEERERIAGEMHDVVAHALGAMTVQAAAARRLVDGDPRRAGEVFRAVEDTGREALAELRRLLGVLRREDEELALAPQPRLAFAGDLVRRVKAAGLPTTLTVEGTPPEALPAGVDVTGYRIVQEALRAAMESGGAGRAEVVVRYGQDDVAIEVVDDGRANHPRPMLGMRERVRVYGGELSAGSREHGHRLRARLPLESRT